MTALVICCALVLLVLNAAAFVSWAHVYRPRLIVSTRSAAEPDESPETVMSDETPPDDGMFAAWLAEVEATEQAANVPAAEPEIRWRQWADRGAMLPGAADSCRPRAER